MSRNLGPLDDPASKVIVARVENVGLSATGLLASVPKVNFAVAATSLTFLVGPAGTGKSAILDLLTVQALPLRGRVELFGVDTAKLALRERPRVRRRIGRLFQAQRLVPDLDVFANVALAARVVRRRARDYGPDVEQLLMWVGLGGRGSEAVSKFLTESERRRLCLARALINRPELLLADEPTSGLGDKAERAFLRLVAEAHSAGTPVIFATRNRSLATDVGGNIYDLPVRAVP